jgi:hypothetical protein
MEANTRQLEAIFDPNVFFQVPLFQRPYVWTETDNWEPLWEDIRALLDRQLATGKARAHFLGAIVLEQVPHPAGSIETRQVVPNARPNKLVRIAKAATIRNGERT